MAKSRYFKAFQAAGGFAKKERTMKKIIALVLVAVSVMSLALTGCGGSNSSSKKVKVIDVALTDEDYAFGVRKDDPELLASVNEFVAKIKKDGTLDKIMNNYFGDGKPEGVTPVAANADADQLVVVTNAEFAPFEYTDGGVYYGVDMEIAKLLAESLGKELVIMNVDFDSVCLTVGEGLADIAMAGLTVNETRTKSVTFSDSYYKASQYLIAMESDTTFDSCKTVEDVEKILGGFDNSTTIGVQSGTTGQYYVEGDEDWGFAGFPVKVTGYSSGALAVQDMVNGNIKYVVIDQAPAEYIVSGINKVS